MWTTTAARELAREHLAALGDRWRHVQAVGALTESLIATGAAPDVLGAAAWLHDIGYAPALARSGLHSLDGARFLAAEGAPEVLVGLVGHHTGAQYEAQERGLSAELEELPRPPSELLDALTLVDLSVSPKGQRMLPEARIAEILGRYPDDHPVFRALSKSAPSLLEAAGTARKSLGLTDDWPVGAA